MIFKKLKRKFVAIIVTLGLLTTACSDTSNISDYEEYNAKNNIMNQSTNDNIPESYIQGIVRDPDDAAKETAEAFDKLPDNIKKLYRYSGGKIIIIDDTKDNMFYAGRYTPVYNEIQIKKNAHNIEMTLYHEIGHMLDFRYCPGKMLSATDEFKEIYLEERYNFETNHSKLSYFTEDRTEYFAQAFAEYLLNPERLKENCPRTYEYIDRHVNNYGF